MAPVIGELLSRVPLRYTLNAVFAASVPSSRQLTRLPPPDGTTVTPRPRSSMIGPVGAVPPSVSST